MTHRDHVKQTWSNRMLTCLN